MDGRARSVTSQSGPKASQWLHDFVRQARQKARAKVTTWPVEFVLPKRTHDCNILLVLHIRNIVYRCSSNTARNAGPSAATAAPPMAAIAPIIAKKCAFSTLLQKPPSQPPSTSPGKVAANHRSEEHTSELQS